jgi:hypothetical protein
MAKRSRRVRQQIAEKQKKQQVQIPDAPLTEDSSAQILIEAEASPSERSAVRRGLDFAQEYFYVYTELRTMFLVTVLMFAVLIGLSFVI